MLECGEMGEERLDNGGFVVILMVSLGPSRNSCAAVIAPVGILDGTALGQGRRSG